MSDPVPPNPKSPRKPETSGHKSQRAAALEKALRENLRRRKAAVASSPLNDDETFHEKAKEKPGEGE